MNENTTTAPATEQNAVVTFFAEAYKLAMKEAEAKMDAKLDERLGDFTLDVDNVDGLERYVEDAIDSKVDRAVEDAIEQQVEKALEDYSPEIDADNVDGLDDFVRNVFDEKMNDFSVDADTVEGLDDFVDDRLDSKVADAIGERVDDAVNLALQKQLTPERIQAAVEAALATPRVQLLLAGKLQEALTAAVSRFVGAALTGGAKTDAF